MPVHVHQLFVKTALLLVCATGVVGAVVFGIAGVRAGAHGEFERILAIACVALVAAAYLGLSAQDSIADVKLPSISFGDKVILVLSAPLLVFCTIVFVATLVPAWFVILPTFAAMWQAIFGRAARGVPAAPPPAHGAMREPAYG